ncbi:MAG: MBL fold metallo-hydrolase [Candidatus Moraniibacteriota bacterium]
MNIQYYGDYCFKITTKPNGRATEDVVIVTDVPEKGLGLRAPQGEADIVLLSHQSPEAEELSVVKGEPVKIFVPGEYSAKGVAILGFSSLRDTVGGAKRGQNTIFLFETEEMRLCFLGALGTEPAPDVIERLSGVDILFVPAGDGDTLPVNLIDDLVRKIEPKTVIPMHYKIVGMTTTLPDEKPFCKVMGNCPKETIAKWNVKKKDLEGKNLEVVLLAKN